jgi:hypothetical protein
MTRKIWVFVVFYLIWMFVLIGGFIAALGPGNKRIPLSEASPSVLLAVGALIVLGGGPVIVFVILMSRTPRWKKDLQENGKLAPAQVLSIGRLLITGSNDGDDGGLQF